MVEAFAQNLPFIIMAVVLGFVGWIFIDILDEMF